TTVGQRVEVDRQSSGQGLALTGFHLGDVAEVQCGATHDLDVEVALPQGALGRFPDGREGLRKEIVQRLAALVAFLVLLREVSQFFVAEVGVLVLERVDLVLQLVQPAQDLSLTRAQELTEYPWHFLRAPRTSRLAPRPWSVYLGPADRWPRHTAGGSGAWVTHPRGPLP